jgi:hypothetical protein
MQRMGGDRNIGIFKGNKLVFEVSNRQEGVHDVMTSLQTGISLLRAITVITVSRNWTSGWKNR